MRNAGSGGYGAPIILASGFSSPGGVAADAGGNLFVADPGNNKVWEVPYANGSYGSAVTVGSGYLAPFDVAVDRLGRVYVFDSASIWQLTP